MKRYCFYLVLLLTVTALNGCVKDDNPSPVIRNTTWKRTNGDRWYRFSFSDSRVYGQLYDRKYSETEYTTIDFYADYVEESEGGRLKRIVLTMTCFQVGIIILYSYGMKTRQAAITSER